MSDITAVRRAQSVLWVTREMEQQVGFRQAIEDDLRSKVERLAGYEPGDARVRLVRMAKLEPHDPEFDLVAQREGHVPPDASPWVVVWEVR